MKISLFTIILSIIALLLVFPAGTMAQVDCGGHSADSCSRCPFGLSSFGNYWTYYGFSYCNGECVWDQDDALDSPTDVNMAATQCRPKVETDVDCGYYMDFPPKDRNGFFRPTCNDCLDFSDPAYCAGDCFVKDGRCLHK